MTEDELKSILEAALAGVPAEGIAIGVVAGDRLSFGCRGHRGDDPIDHQTTFYGASVTKQVIGLLLARSMVDGTAHVEDSVLRWLPELPRWMAPIRLRHLIHHTSGIPNVTDPVLGSVRRDGLIWAHVCGDGRTMEFTEMRDSARAVRIRYAAMEVARNGRQWTAEEIMLGFVGDVGDLSKLVQGKAGARPTSDLDEKVAHELADCLWSVMTLADEYGIDLERAFADTMQSLAGYLDDSADG